MNDIKVKRLDDNILHRHGSKNILFQNIVPWEKFSRSLIAACKEEKKLSPRDRRNMVAATVDYMIFDLKDDRRKIANAIAKKIVSEYPQSFADRINGKILGDGSESLMNQIYTKVNYYNRTKDENFFKEAKKGRKRCAQDQTEYKFDEYGCVAYQQLFTEVESEKHQTNKKEDLLLLAAKPRRDICRIKNFLKESYTLQRYNFNIRNGLIFDILQEWPLLKEPQY